MKIFEERDSRVINILESAVKVISRFAIVYVIAFIFGALIAFSSSYRSFCAIAPAVVALFDLVDRKKALCFLSNYINEKRGSEEIPVSSNLVPENLGQRMQAIEAEILEIRKFNEDFNHFRPTIESGFSVIRSLNKKESSTDIKFLQADLAHLKKVVNHNMDCLEQYSHFLNDINEMQYKISNLQNLMSDIQKAQHTLSKIANMDTVIAELREGEEKNSRDISALTKLLNQVSAENTENQFLPLKPSQVTLTMNAVDKLEGHAFEFFCANLLEKSGYENVSVTKGSGDQGVDVLATKGGIKYAIQCKCYSSELGNKPIQEVHAGKDVYGCQIGVVMTNNFFTSGAKALASATGVLLWDRNILQRMLEDVS